MEWKLVFLFLVISVNFKPDFAIAEILVFLMGAFRDNNLVMKCYVSELSAEVLITNPDDMNIGKCLAPVRTGREGQCITQNTTQDLILNITTVIVNINEKYSFGSWKCIHGTKRGSDTLEISNAIPTNLKQCVSDAKFIDCVGWCVTFSFTSVFVVVCFIGYRYKWHVIIRQLIRKRFRGPQYRRCNEGDTGLDEYEVSHCLCATCRHLTAFAFCSNCKGFYCESCYNNHEQDYESHTVLQIKHIHVGKHSAKCSTCNKREPTRACPTCETLYCEQCSCSHKHKPIMVETERNNKTECDKCSVKINENIKTCQSILIPRDELPARICGISVLPNDQVVIADSNNRKLKVLTGKNEEPKSISFTDEPRGMTGMFDYQVAVTFPHNRKIRIFDVNNVNPKETFDMATHGKPFAISYNNELFAVEIGERDDGCIIILTLGGSVHRKILSAKKYAYFTGHTIRLALDKSKEHVFISAMSKKAVTCLDFKGNMIWTQQFTSPRGISFVHGHGKLFLASKRPNRVYEVNAANGNGFALASHGDIMSPRYIAYSQAKSKMYVQVIHGDDEDDKIVALEYNI